MLAACGCLPHPAPDTRTGMVVHSPRKAWSSRRSFRRTEDRRLAALAAAGDESAFEAIFERHHGGLLSLTRHLLGSPEEAEDALQHTFAAAYRQLARGEPPEHLRAWLYATARNRCLDVLRARRELPTELPAASTAGLPEDVERRSDLRELVADIGRLPEDQRAALVMSELGDLGHAEVAEVLGCRPEKVRALIFQARAGLAGWREARALPCRQVREELATSRGGSLRRGHLRRHLKLCAECAAFRGDLDRQRRRVAALLPVLPAIGLKGRVMEAAWGASAAGGAAAAGVGAAGGGAGLGGAALKVAAAALVLGGAGTATFGGLPASGPPAGDGSAPVPASQQREPANAGPAAARPARDRANAKRLRVAKRQASAERRDPLRSEPLSPEPPAPPQPATPQAPSPSLPAPEPQAAPAPQPSPTQPAPALPEPEAPQPPAEERTSEPEVGVDLGVDVTTPDPLP
jgi:RNA polymerase sigma factor (sigma-70 family)